MVSRFPVRTRERTQLIDISDEVARIVGEADVEDGICLVSVPHTTAAVTINENADPCVARDIINGLNNLVPVDRAYTHAEGNSDAHIKSSLLGSNTHLIVSGGKLVLGTWQGIYFCEFDGPRTRSVQVQVIGVSKATAHNPKEIFKRKRSLREGRSANSIQSDRSGNNPSKS